MVKGKFIFISFTLQKWITIYIKYSWYKLMCSKLYTNITQEYLKLTKHIQNKDLLKSMLMLQGHNFTWQFIKENESDRWEIGQKPVYNTRTWSRLKKSSSCHLATKWRNTVAKRKFLVASFKKNLNDTAHTWYGTMHQLILMVWKYHRQKLL